MTTLAILRAARALLAEPAHWCQRVYARDARGYMTTADDPRACAWCAMGAVIRVGRGKRRQVQRCVDVLTTCAGAYVSAWQDRRTHAEVLALFDKAIAVAESEGGDV